MGNPHRCILSILFLIPGMTHAACYSTSLKIVEVVINTCAPAEGQTGNSAGALVTGLVYGEAQVRRRQTAWQLERLDIPQTREYFFFSDDGKLCQQLTSKAPLTMEEWEPCCDVVIVGEPAHPSCSRKVLRNMTQQKEKVERSDA